MVKKKQPKPIFWISGNYYDSKKTFEQICSMLDDPRIIILDCDWVSESTPLEDRAAGPEEIIRVLRHKDIFDKRPRIIKMKGLPHGYTVLVDYLNLVNNKNILVIDGPIGHRAKPPSKQFVSAKTSNFFKTIKKEGKVIENPVEATNAISAGNWVKRVAEEMGKPIEPDAVKLMIDMRGRDLDFLYSGLRTLVDYASGKTIKVEDVEEVCVPVFQKKVWDLLGSISRRKYEEVAVHMQQFYEAGSLEVQSTFVREIELMLGAFKQLFTFSTMACDHLQGKLISSDSLTRAVKGHNKIMKQDEYAKALEKAGGDPKEVVYTPTFTQGFLAMKARDEGFNRIIKWGNHKLHSAFAEVARVRNDIRSENPSTMAYQKVCLDSLMMVLCGKLKPEQAEMLRTTNFAGIIE